MHVCVQSLRVRVCFGTHGGMTFQQHDHIYVCAHDKPMLLAFCTSTKKNKSHANGDREETHTNKSLAQRSGKLASWTSEKKYNGNTRLSIWFVNVSMRHTTTTASVKRTVAANDLGHNGRHWGQHRS